MPDLAETGRYGPKWASVCNRHRPQEAGPRRPGGSVRTPVTTPPAPLIVTPSFRATVGARHGMASMPALVVRPRCRVADPGTRSSSSQDGALRRARAAVGCGPDRARRCSSSPCSGSRLVVSGVSIRQRGWSGRRRTIRLDTIDTLRLRRLPCGVRCAFLGRGFRIGRLWSVPLTLRLQTGAEVRLQLRCVWWDGWHERRPGSSRRNRGWISTAGRAVASTRYVGPVAGAGRRPRCGS